MLDCIQVFPDSSLSLFLPYSVSTILIPATSFSLRDEWKQLPSEKSSRSPWSPYILILISNQETFNHVTPLLLNLHDDFLIYP